MQVDRLQRAALESGEALLKAHAEQPGRAAPLLYLSTTDFVQHKYEPTEEMALDFNAGVDAAIGALDAMGAIVGVTADHGMKDKTVDPGNEANNAPNILMVESHLAEHGGIGRSPLVSPLLSPCVPIPPF